MKPHPEKTSLIGKLAFLFSLMFITVVTAVGHAATFTVNSPFDKAGLAANCVSGTGECTLRSAIQAANASIGVADTIILPAGTYALTLAGVNENAAATGDLDITGLGGALTITGAGAATTIIDGGALDGVFETIFAGGVGANATISGVTIRNGNGDPNLGHGGGIHVNTGTTVTLNNVIVTACKALGAKPGASGVDNSGTLTMNTVAVTNNDGPGGAVNNGAAGVLTWAIGEVSGNTTGGGIQNNGTITLTNVTVSGNNSTVQGAGIDSRGTATLQNVTISGNTSTAAVAAIGGIRNNAGVSITVRNTIISGNVPANCGGTITSLGNNLDNGTTCAFAVAGDLPNTDPLLGALALNGGTLVKTNALPTGSPAIDKGSAIVFPATDARGIVRPVDGNIPLDGVAISDIGAYEFRPQQITVTPASPFDFGTATSGTVVDHVITLANVGDGALAIGTLAAADPLAAPFSTPVALDACSGTTLTLAASCSATVRFAPAVAGLLTDTFSIPSNDPATPTVSFSVSGTGTPVPLPLISITDSIAPATDQQVPFGGVTAGLSADATITVSNPGTANLVIGTIASVDPLAGPFSILNDTCSGSSIAPTATCTLTVRFAPVATGLASDTFDIPSNFATASSFTITVNGTGTPVPVPSISVTDSIAPATDQQVPFGGVTAGQSADATITVSNFGTANLVIGTIASVDPLAGPFSILNDTCSGKSIAPSATCTLTVHFAPPAIGPASDTFDIPSNFATASSLTMTVNGTGTPVAVPSILISDSIAPATDQQVPFGNVTAGSSADATITVSNPGTANLVIGTIASVDPLAGPFSILNDTCSSKTVAPSATCSFTVHFAPVVAGSASDTFDIPSNFATASSFTMTVNGTGTAVALPSISVTDSITPATDHQLPFGGVTSGSSADAIITVSNPGAANLVIGTIGSVDPLAGPFSIVNDTCSGKTVAPSATCTLTVRFAPIANGSASDTFDIPSNVAAVSSLTMTVSGTGGSAPVGTTNSPPTNPALVSPTNGQTGVPTVMAFTWTKSVDPDGDAVSYHLTYGTDPNFTGAQTVNVASAKSAGFLFAGLGSVGGGIIIFGFVSGGGMKRSRKLLLVIPFLLLIGTLFTACGGGGGSTTPPNTNLSSTTITGLAANTTYYWKVVADDGKGGLASSETFSFKTQ